LKQISDLVQKKERQEHREKTLLKKKDTENKVTIDVTSNLST